MKIIIMAAGNGKRWTGSLPKQLTEFDGEALLYRTIRLLAENGAHDITVTVSNRLFQLLDFSKTKPATLYKPKNNTQEIDRFLSCLEIWADETLFLYGDTYYTAEAIAKILAQYTRPASFYGRRRGNDVKKYGEMFALRANTNDPNFEKILQGIRLREVAGEARGLGWDVYRAYEKRNFVELDPRVEDFDKVEEVDIYKKIHNLR